MMKTCIAVCIAFLVAGSQVEAQSHRFSQHPDSARFITDDIDRFWKIVDGTAPDSLADALERDYLGRGTVGLQGFIAGRIRSAGELAATFTSRRERYEQIRESSMNVLESERAIRASFYALEYLYPDAVFPNTWFVVGRLSTGGTVTDEGLLIGIEMFRRPESMRGTVAHELIHFQQRASGQWAAAEASPTLLVVAIMEGSASFVGEIISGVRGNDAAHEYGRAHEATLWAEFQQQMNGTDMGIWAYTDPPGDRPADLGYFLGYRIAEAYYNRAVDKRQAIYDILTTPDFAGLLEKSGYRP